MKLWLGPLLMWLAAQNLGAQVDQIAGDEAWDDRFYRLNMSGGLSAGIGAVHEYGTAGCVIAGGFYSETEVPMHHIGYWQDGAWARWPAAFSLTVNGSVRTLATVGPALYVGGFGLLAPGASTGRALLGWDGASWSDLGGGVNGSVFCLLGDGNRLYVGGGFKQAGTQAATNVAFWEDGQWMALGDGLPDSVKALAVFQGQLIAAASAANGPAYVARWDGIAWTRMAEAVVASPARPDTAIRVLQPLGTNLYVGGAFRSIGGAAITNLAGWDGSGWFDLGGVYPLPGVPSASVDALRPWQGRLLVGGQFGFCGDVPASGLAAWDGSRWESSPGFPLEKAVRLAVGGSNIFAVGCANNPVTSTQSDLARFDGAKWTVMGQGIGSGSGMVVSLAAAANGVIAGGNFSLTSSVFAQTARWDGENWHHLGNDLTTASSFAQLNAVAARGDRVVAGGSFTLISTQQFNRIASWDGSAWQPLGAGLPGTANVVQIRGREILAAVDKAGVLIWNGHQWASLGLCPNVYARAMIVQGANVYVGGARPTPSGGLGAGVVLRWDGTRWTTLGDEGDGVVLALGKVGTNLYVGGGFTQLSGQAARRIARFDGQAWGPVGEGLDGTGVSVKSLAVSGLGELFAGGRFTRSGELPMTNVAVWTQGAWQPLGSGTGAEVTALAWWRGGLHVAGWFSTAGGKVASRFSIWHDPRLTLAIEASAPPAVQRGDAFATRFHVRPLRADAPGPVRVEFALPDGAEFVSADASGTLVGNRVNWTVAVLSAEGANLACVLRSPSSEGMLVVADYSAIEPGGRAFAGIPLEVTVDGSNRAPEVRWLAPTNRTEFTAPASMTLSAEASDAEGSLARLDFFADDHLLGSVTEPPWEYTWQGATAGSYLLRAVATDLEGKTTVSVPALISVLQRPDNDLFANRLPLAGASLTATGTLLNATYESGEPRVAGRLDPSIWWGWTAPSNAIAWVTVGARTNEHRLAVWRGDSLTNLVLLGYLDRYNRGGPTPPWQYEPLGDLRFVAQAGQTYPISVSPVTAYAPSDVELALFLQPLPTNDDFAGALPISGYELRVEGDTFGASAEPGESAHGGSAAQRSLWWSWTAPDTGRLFLEHVAYDRGGWYVGGTVGTLQPVLPWSQDPWVPVEFPVAADQTYYLALDDSGETRVVRCTLRLTPERGRWQPPTPDPIGSLHLTLLGYSESRHAIEASTDLRVWVPISTNVAVNGAIPLDLPQATNPPVQFLRSRRLN